MMERPATQPAPSFVLAHLSDLHVTPVHVENPRLLASKRLLGWLSWKRRRRHEHRPAVVSALLTDLARVGADHVAVTGDLTQLGLPGEVEEAASWLARIGPPERVSLVPGNHDAYAGNADPVRWAPWAAYMRGSEPTPGPRFPYLRRVGPLAIVGLSSARPSAPGLATGTLGAEQCTALEHALIAAGREGRFRVVLVHHPPIAAGQSWRRRLTDAPALRAVLARTGAELVLHGHLHRTHMEKLPGPAAPIPVLGVPSASSIGPRPERRARYHLYEIGTGTLRCNVRGYDPESGCFAAEGALPL